jgi:IclR family transcriptional regulator, acetate operon repressor
LTVGALPPNLLVIAAPAETPNSPTTLQTVERALAFLEVVAEARTPVRVRDVAEALGVKVTTAYHLLNTLLSAGYINRDPGGALRIGARTAVLYNGMLRQFKPDEDLGPIAERLSAETSETVYLCQLTESGVVVQKLVEGIYAVRVAGLHVGFSGWEHARASGKAVLAYMDAPERKALFERSTAAMAASARRACLAELNSEMEVIRSQGWALDEENFQVGASCVAAPYFRGDGKVVGSIAVSVPCMRFTNARPALIAGVVSAARAASEVLGHRETTPGRT